MFHLDAQGNHIKHTPFDPTSDIDTTNRTDANTMLFTLCLDVPANRVPTPIYARDIRFSPKGRQLCTDARVLHPDVLIGYLEGTPGKTSLYVTFEARVGNGYSHARFVPVIDCHYRMLATVSISKPIIGRASVETLMHLCPGMVFAKQSISATASMASTSSTSSTVSAFSSLSTQNDVAMLHQHEWDVYQNEQRFKISTIQDVIKHRTMPTNEIKSAEKNDHDDVVAKVVNSDGCIQCRSCLISSLPEISDSITVHPQTNRAFLFIETKQVQPWFSLLIDAVQRILFRLRHATTQDNAMQVTLFQTMADQLQNDPIFEQDRRWHNESNARVVRRAEGSASPASSVAPPTMVTFHHELFQPNHSQTVQWYCYNSQCGKPNNAPHVSIVCDACGERTVVKGKVEAATRYTF